MLLISACSFLGDAGQTGADQNPFSDTGQAPLNSGATTGRAAQDSRPQSVREAAAANIASHEDPDDYAWADLDDASSAGAVTEIMLDHGAISVSGRGVKVDGPTATITSAGTFRLSGMMDEGQVIVDTQDRDNVQLILNGVELSHSSTSPLYIANAAETIILLAENSVNRIADGVDYQFPSAQTDEPNAAVFSKDNLTIFGPGSLIVEGNFNDGIAAKDGLIIAGGDITVHAADDGIRGKNYLVIKDGRIRITAAGDGLKSDEKDVPGLGYIAVSGGDLDITSGGDALQAETDVLISGGTFNLTTGGGSTQTAEGSARGIRADSSINIDGGTFQFDTADDGINANDNLVINEGSLLIASGDDGLHSDEDLTINGGTIEITDSVEGIEGGLLTINDGRLHIVAGNDGLNVAGGSKESGGGTGNTGQGQDSVVEYSGDHYLYIHGGTIVVNAAGDGIDSNGAIVMTDGVVIVNGPADDKNGAIDYDGTFTMAGGLMVAAGSAAMARTADATSTQNALLLFLDNPQPAGTLIHIEDSSGQKLLTFAPAKAYQSIAFSAPDLREGSTYTIFVGGSAAGTVHDGLYVDGSYQPGNEVGRFTVAQRVTTIGTIDSDP